MNRSCVSGFKLESLTFLGGVQSNIPPADGENELQHKKRNYSARREYSDIF